MCEIMKTIMFMAITVNGFIAREDGFSDFVTADAWKDDLKKLKDAGCCIMGYKTYAYILERMDFPLPCYNVIMTKTKVNNKWKNAMFTAGTPKEILRVLKEKGFKTVFLYGGAKANSSFLKENLVDEFYLYVVPAAFGKGIALLREMDLEAKLRLLKVDRFSRGVIGLHYKVVKVARRIKVHS
jgi:dihydrofolate reductase